MTLSLELSLLVTREEISFGLCRGGLRTAPDSGRMISTIAARNTTNTKENETETDLAMVGTQTNPSGEQQGPMAMGTNLRTSHAQAGF